MATTKDELKNSTCSETSCGTENKEQRKEEQAKVKTEEKVVTQVAGKDKPHSGGGCCGG